MTSGPAAEHTCALEPNLGITWCWGDNQLGELGIGATSAPDTVLFAQALELPQSPVTVALGFQYTCYVTQKGGVQCFGADQDGQLGNGAASADQLAPVTVGF